MDHARIRSLAAAATAGDDGLLTYLDRTPGATILSGLVAAPELLDVWRFRLEHNPEIRRCWRGWHGFLGVLELRTGAVLHLLVRGARPEPARFLVQRSAVVRGAERTKEGF